VRVSGSRKKVRSEEDPGATSILKGSTIPVMSVSKLTVSKLDKNY
jgi:hypothetical protein